MLDELIVEELIQRTATGYTQPFVCRLSDENLYIVKGRGATNKGLISELVAIQLAAALDLPVPSAALAEVRPSLVKDNADARSSIGPGVAFASRQIFDVVEVDRGMIDRCSQQLLRKIFLFDYWISNADRTGTSWGGNSNILMHTGSRRITIIDHNLAFDDNFDVSLFRSTHICADFWFKGAELYDRQLAHNFLKHGYNLLPSIIDSLPFAWSETEGEYIDRLKHSLAAIDRPVFWQGLES